MTEGEVRSLVKEAAKAAAREAVEEVLIKLGVDTDDPTEMQRDMAWLRSWRESSESMKRHGMLTALGVVVVGGLALLWTYITKGAP